MKTNEKVMDMLPGDLKAIAKVAGIEAAVRIAKIFKGSFIYVPGLDELTRVARDATIRKEYRKGGRARNLARKHGIGERQIRKIVSNPGRETLPDEIIDLLKEN